MTRYLVTVPEDVRRQEREYLDALQRIMDGKPTSQRLIEQSRQGLVMATQVTVAMEAGRARGPISGRNARWPRVRDEIERAAAHQRGPASEPSCERYDELDRRREISSRAERLRMDNRELKQQLDRAFTSMASMQLLLVNAARETTLARRSPEELADMRRSAENSVSLVTPATRAAAGPAPVGALAP